MNRNKVFRLPLMSTGAEFLVMGYLMRRNILTYKAPPGNEGYDLICIHPDPRHRPSTNQLPQVRVQVKSRYATDCDRSFILKEATLDAFDFIIVTFLNIGTFFDGNDGTSGDVEPEFYTLPNNFVRQNHDASSTWQKVKLRKLATEIEGFKNYNGFEQIAAALGIPRPQKPVRVEAERYDNTL